MLPAEPLFRLAPDTGRLRCGKRLSKRFDVLR
jgi:hypothetical protein